MSPSEAPATSPSAGIKSFVQNVWPWLVLVAILAVLAYSWTTEGIIFELLGSELTAEERVDSLKNYFLSYGRLAPVAYVSFVIAEVIVVPIPGVMLYAPGGLVFGPFLGGVLAIIGNTLGAGIACAIGRRARRGLAGSRVGRMFETETVQKLSTYLEQRGGWFILFLRVNPLTSSDVISYAAGFSGISVPQTMLATAVGISPLCFAQSWLSENLLTHIPQLIYPLAIGGIVYFVVIIVILRRLLARKPAEIPPAAELTAPDV